MNIIDIKTYPKGLKDILESNKEIILKKIENKRKLDDLENAERYNRDFHNPGKAQEERINNINNFTSSKEYKDIVNKYNSVSEEIDNFFKTENLDILLIHFTRLMGYEKKDILENGMEMLSDNLICNKVSKLFENNLLTKKETDNIISNMEKLKNNEFNREKIWFVNYSYNNNENNICQLLQKWGGEYIYRRYDENVRCEQQRTNIEKKLFNISKPCIIKAEIPYSIIMNSILGIQINEFIIENYFNLPEKEEHGFDCYIEQNLSNESIIEILEKDDEEFEKITNYKNWSTKLI